MSKSITGVNNMGRRTGLYFGYFTSETIKNGKSYFWFTTHNHPSLTSNYGVRFSWVKKQTLNCFEKKLTVKHEREEEIRISIKQKTLIVLKLDNGKLIDIFDLVPRNITK